MDHEIPKHQKIRFRRHEITDLGLFPSAEGQDLRKPRAPMPRRAGKAVLGVLAIVVALVCFAVALVVAIGYSGVGTERMRIEAEKAIEAFAGVDIDASLGPARVSIDRARFLALSVRDVSLKNGADGAAIVSADEVQFGLRLLPLLGGQIRLGSARIADARIMPAAMPFNDRADWTAALRNEQGLLDPDKLVLLVFDQLDRALDAVQMEAARQIELDNVEFILPEQGRVRVVRIVTALLTESGPGKLSFSAEADIDGRKLIIAGHAARDVDSRRIIALDIDVSSGAMAVAGAGNALGALTLKLTGQEGAGTQASQLNLAGTLKGSVLDFGLRGAFASDVALDASLAIGANKVEIERLQVATGRSTFDFNGAVGPRPPTNIPGDKPAYRYELVSGKSSLAPEGSPEPFLDFGARISGTYEADRNILSADHLGVRSQSGEVLGTAALEFAAGKSPGVSLAVNVRDMQVSHVKQLWPWFAAGPARRWVFEHLFGGRVNDGDVRLHTVPGQLGNGVPLTGTDLSGTFDVEGVRFDTTGLIPPVRDAKGSVEFRGNDVDIALSSGTVFMPSGRSVAVSEGTLQIRKANVPPVIGALDMQVAGDAAAVAELAAYEPMNALRRVDFTADDLAGTVSGTVKADIPLQKGVDTSKLAWHVALDYSGLSIAKPFSGQMVSSADGTIVVEPDKAVIEAKANLNGVPAEISLVEPLRPTGPERSRKVSLVLDDKGRDALVPGLSTMVSGKVKVALDTQGEGVQQVSADLTSARLDIPWAGWSKGPGIAANVTFDLTRNGDVSKLSDFKLQGQTFAVNGAVTLSGGSFSSADFSSARLNRGDDVAVSIKRSGKNYAIDVSGDRLDARSLIKQFTVDVDTATKSTSSGSVSVDADIKTLIGFNDEQMSNLKLDYTGAGSKVTGLRVSAVSKSGTPVTIQNTAEGGQRSLKMQSADAGAILRFLDIYDHMEGGAIKLALSGPGDGPMSGTVDARDFWIVNEPRLASIVSTPPPGADRSLNQAVKSSIDTSRVQFERGFAQITKGDRSLKLANGVLRGPTIGTTFQGTLYDKAGNMDMTGTFMPAYGLNRLFGEIPLFGMILGNGRDRGLIGVTYKLDGDANSPRLQINPLSVIAPGIFRSIFEYQ